jgi:hypothetical protein
MGMDSYYVKVNTVRVVCLHSHAWKLIIHVYLSLVGFRFAC